MNFLKKFAVLFLIAVFLEVFLFNFKFWSTGRFEQKELEIANVGEGLEVQDDGSYIFSGEKDSYIELLNIDCEIDNIYIDLYCDNSEDSGYRQFITIEATDEGNALYYKLPQRVIVPDVERSKYISMETSGVSEKLRINFDYDNYVKILSSDNDTFILRFGDITVNKPVPFFFSALRFLIIWFVVVLIYCLRYNTSIFEGKISLASKKQSIILFLIVLLNILFAIFIYKNNLTYFNWDRHVYTNLAESLLQGRFDLPMLNVSDELLSMENPYDQALREKVVGGAGYFWDYAYYEGSYYVYFGIIPCLLLFLPLKALFNYDIPVNLACLYFMIVYIIVGFRFIYMLIKKFFKDTSFAMYIMLAEIFVFASFLTPILNRNDLYGIPCLSAMIFTMLGLDLWIHSIDNNGNIISDVKLTLGSVCMAAVAGCRPQFVLGSFFALFIFKDWVWNKLHISKREKRDILHICSFALPYIVIAVFLMYYNYARFGSVTDFGAMYNLTTNDMTKRGFRLARVPYGLFAFLFQFPNISATFPFFEPCANITKYMGVTIIEHIRGGIFIINPLLWLNILYLSKETRNLLKQKKLLLPGILLLIFALIVVIADINMAAVTIRYSVDFTWMFMLSAFAVLLCIMENVSGENKKRVRYAFSIVFLISMAANILIVFCTNKYFSMDSSNPNVFYSILYALEFWL